MTGADAVRTLLTSQPIRVEQGKQQVEEPTAAVAERTQPPMRWLVDGEEYDLTDFLPKHPGGADLLLWCRNRDISVAVHAMHKDPQRTVLPILRRYKVAKSDGSLSILKSKLGIPHFLLPAKFEAKRDIPVYDFNPDDPGLFLNTCRKKVLAKGVQLRLKQLDGLFDATVVALILAYLLLVATWLSGLVPWWVAVPAFTALRTSLAGGGHYYLHRRKPHVGEVLFDMNYVGTAFTGQDGHTLIHHSYTQSDADVKRGFFGGMLAVPRLLRVPAHTLHKLGFVTTGALIRGVEIEVEANDDEHQGVQITLRKLFPQRCPVDWRFWGIHLWLRAELVLALCAGLGWSWLLQFFTSLWLNTFLVVSSHDFTEALEKDSRDWARYQLLNAHDMSLVGNEWVDCFLSAGLAPHRAHHIFPYQKSGWANIHSNSIIAEAAKEHGLPWLRPKCFWTEILPVVLGETVFAPAVDRITRKRKHSSFLAEHLALSSYLCCGSYVLDGFRGIGAI